MNFRSDGLVGHCRFVSVNVVVLDVVRYNRFVPLGCKRCYLRYKHGNSLSPVLLVWFNAVAYDAIKLSVIGLYVNGKFKKTIHLML